MTKPKQKDWIAGVLTAAAGGVTVFLLQTYVLSTREAKADQRRYEVGEIARQIVVDTVGDRFDKLDEKITGLVHEIGKLSGEVGQLREESKSR